jgi:hypothetical protein
MAGGIDWFRWHHGSVTDPKFQLVAKKAGVRLGDVIAVWAFVLEKASADVDRGTIGQIDFETLDFLLGTDEGTAARILDAMTGRGLIAGDRIAKWEERQPKREDDTAAERKRRQREREHEMELAVTAEKSHHVPPVSRDVTHGHDRGEERREEEKKPTVSAPDKPVRRSRGARFAPDEFEVSPAMQAWAAESAPLVDWKAETDKFRDWEFKHPRSDWDKVWRTWMRKAQDDAAARGTGRQAASQQGAFV